MSSQIIEALLAGKKTRLTIVSRWYDSKKREWKCRAVCECGEMGVRSLRSVINGLSRSCGCLHDELAAAQKRTHGKFKTRAYGIWASMKHRCSNPNSHRYYDYGGRGIKVCERWNKFEAFLEDMGNPPKGTTLDRIDNDKGYSPDNCRWATLSTQQRNRRGNRYLELNGVRMTLPDWADKLGILPVTIRSRLRNGWSVERTLTEPLDIETSKRRRASARIP